MSEYAADGRVKFKGLGQLGQENSRARRCWLVKQAVIDCPATRLGKDYIPSNY